MLLLLSADFFFKIILFQNISRTRRVTNSLDPDQERLYVSPDLGPNCLQRLSVDENIARKEQSSHTPGGSHQRL